MGEKIDDFEDKQLDEEIIEIPFEIKEKLQLKLMIKV